MTNDKQEEKYGVLDIEYAEGRKKNKALKYRLRRRTHEVHESIKTYLGQEPHSIIDLGTAEGRMLNELHKTYPECRCVGVEYNSDLVGLAKEMHPELEIHQGDVQDLSSFNDGEFDVAIATAVIEHVESPEIFISEISRMLRPGGLLIMTAPDPFWEHIATMVGHLADEQHHEVPNLKRLRELAEGGNMKVLLSQKFMLSPVGMPAEFAVEKLIRAFGLSFMMANQLVVAVR